MRMAFRKNSACTDHGPQKDGLLSMKPVRETCINPIIMESHHAWNRGCGTCDDAAVLLVFQKMECVHEIHFLTVVFMDMIAHPS